MSAAGGVGTTAVTWRALLPAGRTFVALPSRTNPVIVADRDPDTLAYVRRCLLARPPRSRAPGWAYEAARQALRLPVAWRCAAVLRPTAGPGRERQPEDLATWLAGAGHRLIVLEHSHDPDARFVVLVMRPGDREPSVAIKVAASAAASGRIEDERRRLRLLENSPLGPVRHTMPRLLELPGVRDGSQLVTTAKPGTLMFVACYRNGHTRRPAAVRCDFAAAQAWLARLQSVPTGPAVQLGVAQSTIDAAQAQQGDGSHSAPHVLLALRRRLGRHRAAGTVVHGDFWAGNILVRDGGVSGVVDWERAEPAGSPIRDLGRFATAYSYYLDRHTRAGRAVAGHRGLRAAAPGGGLAYAINGAGWYPSTVRNFLMAGLQRLGLPGTLGPDVMLAELAAMAAEATDPQFGREMWRLFVEVGEVVAR